MTGRRLTHWRVERSTATAAELLEPWPAAQNHEVPVVRLSRVTGRAGVVLGSTQDPAVIDRRRAEAAGIDVVRRTTGGGAVLVAPDRQVWIDIWVPRHEALWDDDVIRAAGWVGDAWVMALRSLGAPDLVVHRGPATRTAWSDLVCFAGLGPGEVQVAGGGAKVTGLAQRRTAAGARFHASAPMVWDPTPLLALIENSDTIDTTDAHASLVDAAVGLRALLPTARLPVDDVAVVALVEDAVVRALP